MVVVSSGMWYVVCGMWYVRIHMTCMGMRKILSPLTWTEYIGPRATYLRTRCLYMCNVYLVLRISYLVPEIWKSGTTYYVSGTWYDYESAHGTR